MSKSAKVADFGANDLRQHIELARILGEAKPLRRKAREMLRMQEGAGT